MGWGDSAVSPRPQLNRSRYGNSKIEGRARPDEAQFRKWEQAAREGADVKTVRLNSLRLAKAAAETVAASSQAIAPYDRKPRSLSRGAAAVRSLASLIRFATSCGSSCTASTTGRNDASLALLPPGWRSMLKIVSDRVRPLKALGHFLKRRTLRPTDFDALIDR